MDTIIIRELAVEYHVGVTEAERAHPQRLLINLEIEHDLAAAADTDDLHKTVDYFAVCQRLLRLGQGRSWKLIETLAVEIAGMIQAEFGVKNVTVEVKKMIIPETRYVGVRVRR